MAEPTPLATSAILTPVSSGPATATGWATWAPCRTVAVYAL